MVDIGQALERDIDAIYALDQIAQSDEHRRTFIRRAVADASCFVALSEQEVVGYVVLEYSFFENGFVSLLNVHPEHRRHKIGSALMQYLESVCKTPKLFTSTNLSNLPMQSLLANREYLLSGVIHNLDEGDPELVYVKYLSK